MAKSIMVTKVLVRDSRTGRFVDNAPVKHLAITGNISSRQMMGWASHPKQERALRFENDNRLEVYVPEGYFLTYKREGHLTQPTFVPRLRDALRVILRKFNSYVSIFTS